MRNGTLAPEIAAALSDPAFSGAGELVNWLDELEELAARHRAAIVADTFHEQYRLSTSAAEMKLIEHVLAFAADAELTAYARVSVAETRAVLKQKSAWARKSQERAA